MGRGRCRFCKDSSPRQYWFGFLHRLAPVHTLRFLFRHSPASGWIFWDPEKADYFVPRGFAYQTFNPPVGANQTFDQIEYDFTEFKKMYANSVRVEFVWNQIEPSQGQFDWSKPDFLVAKARELGLRLFVLIAFNYPPEWFPGACRGTNELGGSSFVVNYEHPEARRAYSNYVFQVANQYRNSSVVGAWILGNEYAYYDLWDSTPEKHFLGYDPISQASFRSYLRSFYSEDIGLLNQNWRTNFTSFDVVVVPASYPRNRTNDPGYFDLFQWRKQSIGDYVAVGAAAARRADTNHLRTYSMIGAIFTSRDAQYTCEDAATIVARCAAAGAPLDFWSLNNYPWAVEGTEMRSGDFGIAKYKAQSGGLPILITETGYSSSEDAQNQPGAAERQPWALPSQLWEAFMSAAIGVHIFTWNDRNLYRGDNHPREKGFGIVNQDR